jgi:hypothetical protein
MSSIGRRVYQGAHFGLHHFRFARALDGSCSPHDWQYIATGGRTGAHFFCACFFCACLAQPSLHHLRLGREPAGRSAPQRRHWRCSYGLARDFRLRGRCFRAQSSLHHLRAFPYLRARGGRGTPQPWQCVASVLCVTSNLLARFGHAPGRAHVAGALLACNSLKEAGRSSGRACRPGRGTCRTR